MSNYKERGSESLVLMPQAVSTHWVVILIFVFLGTFDFYFCLADAVM